MGKKFLRVIVVLVVSLAAGFAFGRYGLGEGYLKHTFEAIPTQKPTPTPIQPAPTVDGGPLATPEIPALAEESSNATERKPPAPQETPQVTQPTDDTAQPNDGAIGNQPEPLDTGAIDAGTTRNTIQAGTFESESSANTRADKLAGLGYPTQVTPQQENGRTVYRVTVGSYADENAARSDAEQLRKKGYDAFVTQE